MEKPTVRDIARKAGVSLATVDRVLNERPGVRARTIERVNDAIRSLGYVRDLSAANLARQRRYRFAFVLPEGQGQFVATLIAAIEEAAATFRAERIVVDTLSVPSDDPHLIVRTLRRLGATGFEGIAIMAPETPQLRDAVARLKDEGIAVVAFVSDLPNSRRDHFVGIKNVMAGRTAGVLMGRFLAGHRGKVLAITGSLQSRDSVERRLGFDEVVSGRFPAIHILPTLEGHDDTERVARIVGTAFEVHPDIAGVYSFGSDNTPLLNALAPLRMQRDLTVIAHELTPAMRAALLAGHVDAVITQDVGHLARSAIRVLKAKSDQLEILASQERIRIDIVLRENLPQ